MDRRTESVIVATLVREEGEQNRGWGRKEASMVLAIFCLFHVKILEVNVTDFLNSFMEI